MSVVKRARRYDHNKKQDDHQDIIIDAQSTSDFTINLQDPVFVFGSNITRTDPINTDTARIGNTVMLTKISGMVRIIRQGGSLITSSSANAIAHYQGVAGLIYLHVYLVRFINPRPDKNYKASDFITRATDAQNLCWARNKYTTTTTQVLLHKVIELNAPAVLWSIWRTDTLAQTYTSAFQTAITQFEINWSGHIPLQYVPGVSAAEPPRGNRVQLFVLPHTDTSLLTEPVKVEYFLRTRFKNMM